MFQITTTAGNHGQAGWGMYRRRFAVEPHRCHSFPWNRRIIEPHSGINKNDRFVILSNI